LCPECLRWVTERDEILRDNKPDQHHEHI
jgi:hypothetical protein